MLRDKITIENVSHGLATRFVGQIFQIHAETMSTMDLAREAALQKTPEGTAIFAERQNRGRGRLKREWLTPPGNIAVSIVLYPPKTYLPSLIMLSSLSVKRSIETVTGLKCQLKWPNDVLINGKKVSGILIETKIRPDAVDYAVIGIGINANMKTAGHREIQAIATSLSEESGHTVDRTALLRRLFIEMEELYTASLPEGESLFPLWQANLVTLGKQVRARNGDEVFEGIAETVNTDGSLMLRLQDGRLLRFTVGDVTLRV